MKIKNLIDEDFIQYKKPSMFIGMPNCSFKCDKEAGCEVCQNSDLAAAPTIEIEIDEIAKRYSSNPITEAIIFGGLDPFDDFLDLYTIIQIIRNTCMDDIIIYTGYYPNEVKKELDCLKHICNGENIIVKFGRFIPNRPGHYDELLGVTLASDNQYAKRLEDWKIGGFIE